MNLLDAAGIAALMYLTGYLAIRWERGRQTPSELPTRLGFGVGPDRQPPPPRLTPAEQAHLAALARHYAHGDPKAGIELADHLRRWCPGVTDIAIMRCTFALTSAARTFTRKEPTAAGAMAGLIAAAETAALELAELERNEIPP